MNGNRERGEGMRGQLSAEMLILLALVLGLLLVAYTYMSKTVNDTGKHIDAQTARVLAESTYCTDSGPCGKLELGDGRTADCNTELKHCELQ